MSSTHPPSGSGHHDVLGAQEHPDLRRSLWQLANSVVPYVLLWVLMVHSLSVSYALTLGLAVLASGFLVRIFIIFHDCGHGSFFRSRRANDVVGFLTGALTLTPHRQWWRQHLRHHGSAGDLDRRGTGDVWTMTVKEYRAASRWRRLVYRTVRQPFFMLAVGPFVMFAILARFPTRDSRRPEVLGIMATNLVIAGAIAALVATIGWRAYLMIHLPIVALSGAAGIWLFYVQHQFEGAYWSRRADWDYVSAAVEGSSFYRLPRLLQWFSGNIGFHHVHHLNARVPNYRLEECHRGDPQLRSVRPVTLRASLASLSLRLWDEEAGRMVGFAAARASRASRAQRAQRAPRAPRAQRARQRRQAQAQAQRAQEQRAEE
ncbi:MAG: fatty acid desaturase [Candidatus Krumholzibacteriia bacterium]